jgi:hypothetical protein
MLISGRMPGIARASKVLPALGLATIGMLWEKDRTLFRCDYVHLMRPQGNISAEILHFQRQECIQSNIFLLDIKSGGESCSKSIRSNGSRNQ